MLSRALNVFRTRAPHALAGEALPAVFVLEPTMYVTSAVVASWDPAATLQVLGGASRPERESVRETLGWALTAQGLRTVVVCGEGSEPPPEGAAPLAACRALLEDAVLGPLVAQGVTLEALWFDRAEGDIHRWDPAERRWSWLSDPALATFFAELRARA